MDIDSKHVRFLARMGSRGAFGEAVWQMARDGIEFFALSADMARPAGFERLIRDFPQKVLNVGIAEQNMMGVATGLSRDGTPCITATWSPFATFRCADQVRNYCGYMCSNVKMVGLDGGMASALFGYSHYALEDIALMRAIPNVTVICPSDALQIYLAAKQMLLHKGPVYLRLTGKSFVEPIYTEKNVSFTIGKANVLQQNGKIAMIATGTILSNAIKACRRLEEEGMEFTIIDLHTIKPLDTVCLDLLSDYDMIFTVEEHSSIGGLGSSVAEYFASKDKRPRHIILGTKDEIFPPGSHEYLLEQNGLSPFAIAQKMKEYL